MDQAIDVDLLHATDSDLREAIQPILEQGSTHQFSNWAKTFQCQPERVYWPETVLQCRQIVELARRQGQTVHPVGVGHSPSDLACTSGWLIRMTKLNEVVKVGNLDFLLQCGI